jgi:hypothetical protein
MENSEEPREIKDGKVISSNRLIWYLSETDILDVAAEDDILLSEAQLDSILSFIVKKYSSNGEWHDIIEEALEKVMSITK